MYLFYLIYFRIGDVLSTMVHNKIKIPCLDVTNSWLAKTNQDQKQKYAAEWIS